MQDKGRGDINQSEDGVVEIALSGDLACGEQAQGSLAIKRPSELGYFYLSSFNYNHLEHDSLFVVKWSKMQLLTNEPLAPKYNRGYITIENDRNSS